MAANKKGKKKKASNSKRTASKKVAGSRHASQKKPPKKLASKRISKKAISKRKKVGSSSKKAVASARPPRQKATGKDNPRLIRAFEPETGRSRSGGQSGDLQGLSDIERADSESVDELLEEGNAFEAEAVAGVEHVEDDEAREVHTHEVPEDDVPQEYLDKDE